MHVRGNLVAMETKAFFPLILLLLFLFASRDESGTGVIMVMGRTCESQSHGFQGVCLSDNNCGLVCRNEGFSDGWCRGFRQRCFCTKAC